MTAWEETLKLLGENNVEKIRDAVTEAIIGNITESINDTVLFDSDSLYNSMEKLVNECMEKHRNRIEEMVVEKIKSIMDGIHKEAK